MLADELRNIVLTGEKFILFSIDINILFLLFSMLGFYVRGRDLNPQLQVRQGLTVK
jgi:hypothetical protein